MLWDTLDRGLTDSEGIHILPTMHLSVPAGERCEEASRYKEPVSVHITVA